MTTEFKPDYDADPGGFVSMLLSEQGLKKVDLATRTGRPTKTISEICSNDAAITPETAIQLERVLGVSADMFLKLQHRHQLQSIRREEQKRHDKAQGWISKFPLADMRKVGFIDQPADGETSIDYFLRYFRVSTMETWEDYWRGRILATPFKQTGTQGNKVYGVAAWLNQGERLAGEIRTEPYDEAAFRSALTTIRAMTAAPWASIQAEFLDLCRRCGVAVVLLPAMPKSGMRGAALWAHKDKAVILLSDHLKNETAVWFTFFHEAMHLLHHSKKSVFIDWDKSGGTAEADIEADADESAANFLIPAKRIAELRSSVRPRAKKSTLDNLASGLGISTGLLLVRLHHEQIIDQDHLVRLKGFSLKFPACEPFV